VANVLVCWVGATDLRASRGEEEGLGPIANAVAAIAFDEVVLLSNYPKAEAKAYGAWLKKRFAGTITPSGTSFKNPTDYTLIYEQAAAAVEATRARWAKRGQEPSLTYHLSPGTPAMTAVWILLAKTRFPAALIQSSREAGVEQVVVPFDIAAEFIPDVLRASDETLKQASLGKPPEAPSFENIIRKSAAMERVVARANKAARRSVPVLIEGESGTGKELFANAIHKASPRADKPFVPVNCGAIPKHLVESELFGHVKGAFTGANEDRRGHFQEAHGGTLFLDELGELPADTQVALLRVLQDQTVVPVGSSKAVEVDVRIIAATNRSLAEEVDEGRFRADLFFRLAVAVIQLPPLRERKGDLGLLIEHLLDATNDKLGGDPGYERKEVSPGARSLLLRHTWPGNVRELENTLVRAAIWSDGPTITKTDMREAMFATARPGSSSILGRPLGNGFKINEVLDEVARHYLERAREEASTRKEAADLLGLKSHQVLGNWIKNLKVDW